MRLFKPLFWRALSASVVNDTYLSNGKQKAHVSPSMIDGREPSKPKKELRKSNLQDILCEERAVALCSYSHS